MLTFLFINYQVFIIGLVTTLCRTLTSEILSAHSLPQFPPLGVLRWFLFRRYAIRGLQIPQSPRVWFSGLVDAHHVHWLDIPPWPPNIYLLSLSC